MAGQSGNIYIGIIIFCCYNSLIWLESIFQLLLLKWGSQWSRGLARGVVLLTRNEWEIRVLPLSSVKNFELRNFSFYGLIMLCYVHVPWIDQQSKNKEFSWRAALHLLSLKFYEYNGHFQPSIQLYHIRKEQRRKRGTGPSYHHHL